MFFALDQDFRRKQFSDLEKLKFNRIATDLCRFVYESKTAVYILIVVAGDFSHKSCAHFELLPTIFSNAEIPGVEPLGTQDSVSHAYHLYVVKLDLNQSNVKRSDTFSALRAEGIGANVHYIPVHLHSFYRKKFHTGQGLCPMAEAAYEQI
ncbi:unnamed protein product, partial [marine sediment metagenome]